MDTPIYALPADELAASVTPTLVEGTEDADYPLTNMIDGVLTTVFKPDSTAAFEIEWAFGSPKAIGPVALFHIGIEAGSLVKLYVTDTAYPGAPSGADTYDVVIPATLEDGRRENPHVSTVAPIVKSYVRLRVPAQLVAPASIGEIKISLGPTRQLARSFSLDGVDEIETRPQTQTRSPVGGKTSFDYGVTLQSYDVKRYQMDETEKAEFLSLKRTVKIRLTPWLFIFDPLVNDAWLVQFGVEPIIRKVPESIYPDELWDTSFLLDVVSGGVPPA